MVVTLTAAVQTAVGGGGGGGRGEREGDSSSSQAGTHGNLLEDSHGPAAAERTPPRLSEYQTERNKDPTSGTPSSFILPQKNKKHLFLFLV